MSELSPAAQAVLDALDDQFYELNSQHMAAAVAALRAAADQVVPATQKPDDELCCPPVSTIVWTHVMIIRKHFIAVANELEAVNA